MATEHTKVPRTAANDPQPRLALRDKYDGEIAGMAHHGNRAKHLGEAAETRWERERKYSNKPVRQDV